jgi:voltage-gated potassium channel Kch
MMENIRSFEAQITNHPFLALRFENPEMTIGKYRDWLHVDTLGRAGHIEVINPR